MRITPISAQSWQLTRLGFINCYLVREPEGFTLIDTTLAGAASDIIDAAANLGGSIRRVLLTHAHIDHIGSVDGLAAKMPGLCVAASERSLPLLRRPVDRSLRPDESQKPFRGGLPGLATEIRQTFADDDAIGSLRAIATPGHIPGHFSFLDERDGTLFAGDALVAVGRLSLTGWTPWYFPLPGFVMWSKPTAIASAVKLLDYPIERFACGHGPVRSGGFRALRNAIVTAEMVF